MGWPTADASDVEMASDAAPLDKAVKNLISESAVVFEGLTRRSTSVQDAARAYRSALHGCVREMDSGNELSEVVKASLALLHLCEILYFSNSSAFLPYTFGAWMQEHYGSVELEDLDDAFLQLQGHVSLDTSDDDVAYWPTIIQLVISGNGRKAWELLSRTTSSFHSKYSSSLDSIRHLLVHMPTTSSDAAFNWASWHDAIDHLLHNDPLVLSDAHIRLVLELLSGQHLDQHARSWHQLVVAKCLLEDPKAHLSAAATGRRIAQRMESAFLSALPPFEQIVLLLLQYDLTTALDRIHSLSAGPFPWFLAHLTDLLARQRELAPTEMFMLAFVQASLVPATASSSLWPLAALYLEQCPAKGGAVILDLVHRLPVESDFTAAKLLDVCSSYNLPKAAAAIATRRGQAWEANHKVAIALTWYLRAGNVDAINTLCESIVGNPSQHGHQLDAAADVLSAEAPTLSPTVSFLVQYYHVTLVLRDLAHLQEAPEAASSHASHPKLHIVQRDAARRLGGLCTQCHVPRHLWHATWSSVVPLLHLSPPVFSSHELYGLLEALQDHEIALGGTDETDLGSDKDLVAQLRRAIAVGLSQTLLVDV